MKRFWLLAMALTIAGAALTPKPAHAVATSAAVQACLPQGSICINLPPPTEQCCGSNFCKPSSPNGRGGVCTPF